MKDYLDFVALGEKLGYSGDKLEKFADTKYSEYTKSVEEHEQKSKDAYDREIRLLDRKAKIAESEKTLVESTGNDGARSSPHVPAFRFTPFNDKTDDLDSWFNLFEKQCTAYSVKDKDRKAHLLSLFSGQYRDAFLSLEASATYEIVRAHLLQTFNLTKHDYRQKFFDMSPKKDENIVAFCQRLSACFDKWVSLSNIDKDFKSLRDLILTHKVFDTVNTKLKAFLVERDCNTLKGLEDNATHFFNAHADESLQKVVDLPFSANYAGQVNFRGRDSSYNQNRGRYRNSGSYQTFQNNTNRNRFDNSNQGRFNYNNRFPRSQSCGRKNANKESSKPEDTVEDDQKNQKKESKHSQSQIICFACGGRGHIKKVCPNFLASKCTVVENWKDNLQFSVVKEDTNDFPSDCTFFKLPDSLSISSCNSSKVLSDQHIYEGLLDVDGVKCNVRVLRDTGSMIHAIHKKFVRNCDYSGKTLSLITFGGRKEIFQLADIVIDTPFLKGKVSACVLDSYPEEFMYYDVLVGNGGTLGSPRALDPSPDIVKEWDKLHKEIIPANVSNSLAENSLSDVLSSNQVQTRAQKMNETRSKSVLNDKVLSFDISYSELATLQKEDETLSKYFGLVGCQAKQTKNGSCTFEIRNDILVRLFNSDRYSLVQVMVPVPLRAKILSLGHDMPFSAHMGISRTLARVSSSFFWPNLTVDVRMFCRSCAICLKTSPKGRTPKAPLQIDKQVIDKPFYKVATDLIGPLPISHNKSQYVLTLVDYATRWVEASPMKPPITAAAVAEEFVKIFSRIGFPSILLSDGGSQFVAELMENVLKILGIKHSVSTAYHPQTNGLCERANGTIKSLICKVAHDNPGNWDRLLPCVLFAYRESPQETTGFAPFELVYGSVPRGPMTLVRDLWLQPSLELDKITIDQYVNDLKERISNSCKYARKKIEKQMLDSKERYDVKSKNRSLSVGDNVLLLLPLGTNKINCEWKGPFSVVSLVPGSDVNYVIDINGKQKIYHINMLKKYVMRPQNLIPEVETVCNVSSLVPNEETLCNEILCNIVTDKTDVTKMLSCSNVSVIDDICEETDAESFSQIELPSLKQTESINDVKVNYELTDVQKSDISNVLHEFSNIFTDCPLKTECIEHVIELTSENPVHLKPYPLPFSSEKIVNEEVDSMLKAGVISESVSPYSSPIVLVKKKDNKTRFCIDFRKINSLTISDATPIPDQERIFTKLSKAKFFTKLDLTKGYWQVPIAEDSRKYTAFQAGSKLYEFNTMAFGLKNAPATFNRMMAKLLGHRDDVVYFFDDVLIFSDTWAEHIKSIREILAIFVHNNLAIRPLKSEFGYFQVGFLGHLVGNGLLKPLPDNVSKILSIKIPKTKKQVRSIIGLINYYAKFMPDTAVSLIPLFKLTEKGMPDKVVWTDCCQKALIDIQFRINNNLKLFLPDISKMFYVQTDSSLVGIGGVLLQSHNEHLRPCLFLSRKLLERETRYSTIERECLGLVWTLQKLSRYLLQKRFILYTDHRPFVYMQKNRTINSRICRWSLILQNFDFTIEHVNGRDNVVADFLSRNF